MGHDDVAVVTYRGGAVENTHRAHIAVVNAEGKLVLSSGNPLRQTYPRSAVKPAQALSVLNTGALDRFGFTDADLALICGSHSSEPRHIERTQAMLKKVGAEETDLQCGGHPPISDAVAEDWIIRGFRPSSVCNNCSGKHVGMIAGAKAMDASVDGYHLPEHPMQARVRQAVAELGGLNEESIEWALDGCNLPTPAFPLANLATMYAKLAKAADQLSTGQPMTAQQSALARMYEAMTRHPGLVAGDGRFCTVLMEAFGGSLVGKTGADGCYGLGVRSSPQTKNLSEGSALGIALKVEDGNIGVLYMLVCEVLKRLGVGTLSQRQELANFHRPPMTNTMGRSTGRAEFTFELRAA